VYIAVIGPGEDATERDCAIAGQVGYLLAEAGATVLTGGLGGVMAAAAQGCARAGGTSIGLLPGADRADASPHLTVSLPTGLGELRNGLLVRAADGLIAVGGSWGTLSEIALARRVGKPVVALRGWQVTDEAGHEQPIEASLPPSTGQTLRDRAAENAAAAVQRILALVNAG